MSPSEWWDPCTQVSGVPLDGRKGLAWTSLSHSMSYYGAVVLMRPSAFLGLSAPLRTPRNGVIEHIVETLSRDEPLAQPFLTIEMEDGEPPRVSGHEGRHRMHAIRKVFGDVEIPVLLSVRGKRARELSIEDLAAFRTGIEPEEGGLPRRDTFGAARLNGETFPSPDEVLAESAAFHYEACGLYEDEDLDPADSLAVLKRAFGSSDCDAYADALSRMTGWELVRMSWTGRDGFGHHTLVRHPDGDLVDVEGIATEDSLRRRYRAPTAVFAQAESLMSSSSGELLEDGRDADLLRLASTIRAFRHDLYGTVEFMTLANREIGGIDTPEPAAPGIA